jgi:hypothetical protein
MKNLILILKYYIKGFLIAAVLGILIIIYSFVYDDSYSFIDFKLYMQVNSIMAVPCGLHLWIIYLLDNPETIKNKYQKLFFKGIASYWLGVILSFLVLCSLQLLGHFVNLPYVGYLTDDSLLGWSLLISFPIGLIVYKYLNNI